MSIGTPEFQSQNIEIRNRIIAVFFKSLSSSPQEVVDVSKKCLAQVIAQHRLPKELLQSSLRPVLLNLADSKKLDVNCLQCLGRLLELLTNYFNVALGDKLLDHLRSFSETLNAMIKQTPTQRAVGDYKEIAMIVSIMDVFHLLPTAANKFLDSLVNSTLQLEKTLRRYSSSPFRSPLTKYLNRFSQESVEYFLSRLSDPQYYKLLNGIIQTDLGAPLRKELMASVDKLIRATFESKEATHAGILIVHTMSRHHSEWLSENRKIIDQLRIIWTSNESNYITGNLPQDTYREPRLILECLVKYILHVNTEIDLVY